MSRTLRYILTIILIIAGAMWILTVYRSCQDKNVKTKDGNSIIYDIDSTNSDGASNTGSDDLEDLYIDEDSIVGEYGSSFDESTSGGTDSGSDSGTDDSFETEDASDEGTNDSFNNSASGDAGEFLVVAGAFVAESNAKIYQRQLAKQGYDAKVRVFLGSDYHSVIVGNYETEREALKDAKTIGGEAYVHKKRYPKKKR